MRGASAVWLLACLLFVAGAIRIVFLDESRFIAERQYRSALIARAEFLSERPDVPAWRKEIAEVSAARMGVLEPPLMEHLAALGYRLAGAEHLWIPRLLATLFWLGGGYLLFLLARRLAGEEAALYSSAYFLFSPLGVIVSVSFVPDALMLMLFTAGLLCLVRHEDDRSLGRLLAAGAASGLCVLVKPMCVFAIAGAFVALRWHRAGLRGLFDASAVAIASFVVVPALAYYAYGIYVAGFLADQAEANFLPELLMQPDYWKDTFQTVLRAIGVTPLLLAMLGFAIPADRSFRPLIIGLVAGHFLFCLVFTFHVRFAGYYHLQLAVPVALCLGPAVAALIGRVRDAVASRAMRYASLVAVTTFVVLLGGREIARGVRSAAPIVDPAVARAVGERVGHSDRVIYISEYYGNAARVLRRAFGLVLAPRRHRCRASDARVRGPAEEHR